MRTHRIGLVLICGCVLLGTTTLQAASTRAGSSTSGQQQQLIAQLSAERARLQRERDELSAELAQAKSARDDLRQQLDKTSRQLTDRATQLRTSRTEKERADTLNERYRERLEELISRYEELVDLLKGIEGERDQLAEMATAYDERVLVCERNNEGLHEIASELIDRYENKGFLTILRQKEPVSQLKRVEIENLMDEYQRLADGMRLRFENGNGPNTGPSGD